MEIKEQIILETMHQFETNGLKFTMQDVAHGLHIAKKTIYQFYPSKEDLMTGVLDYAFEKIQEDKRKIIDMDMPITDKIRTIMIAMPDQYNLLDFRKLSDLHEKYPKVDERLHMHLESNWEPVIQLLHQGMEEGKIKKIDIPVLQAMITSGMEYFLSTDVLKNNQISYHDALNEMMDIIMKGIEQK
ncbi:MAG: TetR/AcrR family transcriptional regulator [Solobacterium sp.]|nr:TetR/AcrR family transcriptional regulator [Solobacterium sp.]